MPRLHIDTDMGVDDALALVVAEHLDGASIAALSTVAGNVSLRRATQNALILRHVLGAEARFPVWSGISEAVDETPSFARAFHGEDGLGGATAALPPETRESADAVPSLHQIELAPAPVTILGIGPATNIPALVELYGKANVARIVLMSGAFYDVGNITPAAEFNAHGDPAALARVLGLGVPVTFVPIDLTRKILLPRALVDQWQRKAGSVVRDLLVTAHRCYMDSYRRWECIDGCFPHDSIAVFAAVHPDRFVEVRGRVEVVTDGPERGRTRLIPDDSSHIGVAMGGRLKFVREFLDSMEF